MKYFMLFVIFFILIYLLYYILFIRKKLKYNPKNIPSEINLLKSYYKVNIDKIGYQKVLRILNFVNALMLTILMMIIINLDKFIYKFLIAIILIIPLIRITYYFLAKYLRYLERQSE